MFRHGCSEYRKLHNVNALYHIAKKLLSQIKIRNNETVNSPLLNSYRDQNNDIAINRFP
jgi:hypothetical protein